MKKSNHTNELIHEKSPYLLQHAHNPVNWYAWGEKAFEKSRRENKPIFLSIGYSTCHWCHVMEEESFTSEDIATYLNEHFISIKVDREERPDVDQVYMQAVITMTGAGGWPMSVFLTPDLKPFYGGTYFPPQDKWGRPGFSTLLKAIQDQWQKDHAKLLESSQKITEFLKQNAETKSGEKRELTRDILTGAFQQFHSQFDPEYGGFGPAPKFPRSHALNLLLRFWKRTKEPAAIEMVERTLQAMGDGGMYDQIGGGFHRYSTDAQWHIPHFEKMLYDQALLAMAYLEAGQALHRSQHAQIAREIFDYVLRDMTSPEGAFYSAEDADSLDLEKGKKSEGAFYVWSQEELDQVVGKEAASILHYYYDVKLNGNAAQDPQGEFTGKNILHIVHSIKDTAEFPGGPGNSVEQIIRESGEKLLKVRDKRPRPHLDDKVLTDWNGLMIAAFALGARLLKEPRYQKAAEKAADFILHKMKRQEGRLMHRYRDGEVAIPGFLEDYAFFIYGLIELYETTFEDRYLQEAKFLAEEMIRLFWDEKGNGFFFSGKDSEQLFTQTKEIYDGAIPSGNSVAAYVLIKLSRLLQNQDFEKYARLTLETFSAQLAQYPSGYPFMLMALDFLIGPSQEIVIEGDRNQKETKRAIEIIHSRFLPSSVVMLKSAVDGKFKIRICQNFVCENPITDIAAFEKALDKES